MSSSDIHWFLNDHVRICANRDDRLDTPLVYYVKGVASGDQVSAYPVMVGDMPFINSGAVWY